MTARAILLCLALALALAPAAAAQDIAADRVERAASMGEMEAVVGALGHEVEAKDAAKHSLRAADGEGTRYVLTGTACDIDGVPGCRGIVMQVLYDADAAVTLEKLAEANLNQVAVSTRFDPQSSVISVTRYVVLDGGVTMANVGENIRVLLALAPEVMGIVLGTNEGSTPAE